MVFALVPSVFFLVYLSVDLSKGCISPNIFTPYDTVLIADKYARKRHIAGKKKSHFSKWSFYTPTVSSFNLNLKSNYLSIASYGKETNAEYILLKAYVNQAKHENSNKMA